MDDMRAQMNRPLVVGIVAFLIGLAIGWFVIGWGLWPVEYTGAGIVDLRLEEKVKHLRLGIDAYGFNRNPDQARQVFADLGADAEQALTEVTTNPAGQDPELVRDFAAAVQAGPVATLTPGAPGEAGVVETPAAATEEEGGSIWTTLLTGLCVIVLLAAAAAIVYLVMRSRSGPQLTEEMSPAQEAQKMAREAERTDFKARGEEAPMTQFMTSYKLGDDLFDDSFSIDSPGGEFLGECGVGIAD
ncbi:MAG TPA: hypothetical protein VLS48_09320, partial [Anaerolineales bacterium]|nr:hypothetical protein [Anaerolineales bacterium]